MTRAFTVPRRRLAQLRLAAQHIASADFTTPAEVVRHMLAMQAQDFPGAQWSVGLRMRTATEKTVNQAIEAREIVRSWPMRGTLHLAPAEDLGWMLDLTRDRMVRGAAGRHRELGLDADSFSKAARIAEKQLAASGAVSCTALLAAFDAAGLSTAGQRGTHLLWYLSVTGRLVFGPVDGKQHSFVLLDEWVRNGRALHGDEALAEFARRYFLSHGPASDRDFAWWSSLTLADARRGLSAVEKELEKIEIDGAGYWMAPGLQPVTSSVSVLPGFDEFVLGYQDRSAQLGDDWAERIVPGRNGVFRPTVVVNGEVVGTWTRTTRSNTVAVELVPFGTLSAAAVRGAKRGLERYAMFLNKPHVVLKGV